MSQRYASFREFWPNYVRHHQHPTNRALHLVGTGMAVAIAAAALIKRKPLLLLVAPVAGYGVTVAGHLFFEKNLPTSFSHPIYSLMANFVMVGKMLRGQMASEVERCRATEAPAEADPPPISVPAVEVNAPVASAMN